MQVDMVRAERQALPGRTQAPSATRNLWLALLLVALLPAIMAGATWETSTLTSDFMVWMRFLAPPVIVVEAAAVGIAIAAGFRIVAMIRSLPGWAQAALVLLIAIDIGTALLVAPDRSAAVLRTSFTLIHLLFGLAMAHLLRTARFDAHALLWRLLAAGSLAYVLIAIAYVAAIADPAHFDWSHFGLGVSNIRHASFLVVTGAAAVLGLAAMERRRPRYWLWVAGAALFFAFFFWSGSRGPVLALIGAMGLGAALLPGLRTMRLLVAAVISLVSGAALSLVHSPPDSNFSLIRMFLSGTREGANAVMSGRLDLWRGGLREAMQRPLFGHGENQFITLVPEAQRIYYHPHDMPVQTLFQWGFVGLACMLLLLAGAWWGLLSLARRDAERFAPAFLLFSALLTYSLYDGIFYFNYPLMMLTLLAAICLGAPGQAGAKVPLTSSSRWSMPSASAK